MIALYRFKGTPLLCFIEFVVSTPIQIFRGSYSEAKGKRESLLFAGCDMGSWVVEEEKNKGAHLEFYDEKVHRSFKIGKEFLFLRSVGSIRMFEDPHLPGRFIQLQLESVNLANQLDEKISIIQKMYL